MQTSNRMVKESAMVRRRSWTRARVCDMARDLKLLHDSTFSLALLWKQEEQQGEATSLECVCNVASHYYFHDSIVG